MTRATREVETIPTRSSPTEGAAPGDGHDDVLDLTGVDAPDDAAWLMTQVAVTLGATLELREVLHRLARLGRAATGCRYSCIFLLEGNSLRPVAAEADPSWRADWSSVASLGSIHLQAAQRKLIDEPNAILVSDVDGSSIIPDVWAERFGSKSVVLLPLHAHGQPCGLLAAEWPEEHAVDPASTATLETLGRYAGVAIHNARVHASSERRAKLHAALTRGAAALSEATTPHEMADVLAEVATTSMGARLCYIGLFDADRSAIVTQGSRGIAEPAHPLDFDDVPDHVVARVWSRWERAKTPIEFRDEPFFSQATGGDAVGASWYQLVPIVVEGRSAGLMLFGFSERRSLKPEDESAIAALADLASANLERCRLAEAERLAARRLEVLYDVSAALYHGADAASLVAELNERLVDLGLEVESVAVSDPTIATFLGGEMLTRRERAAFAEERRPIRMADDLLIVPMCLGDRLVGALRVTTDRLDAQQTAFLQALARGLADVANRYAVWHALEEAARHRAVTEERDRLACDLHDTVGQLFLAVAMVARQHADDLSPGSVEVDVLHRVAQMADAGKQRIEEATRDLAFAPAIERGLVKAVRGLVDDIVRDSGLDIVVEVTGRDRRLPSPIERALFRVVHEAVTNAWRHADCGQVRVRLDFGPADVTAVITDDGRGLPEHRPVEGMGTMGMERAMEGVSGSLRRGNRVAGGVEVVATVPVVSP